ncbi:hypothetical protein RIR_jg19869.t1 [Rhizophagus irregularis DAOM 181602=DAOM 197198]|nr:hypothetical protein RIR_jg19869.t1 [Rhizophagus irregularis DAOM 181602=DAOM 197198]
MTSAKLFNWSAFILFYKDLHQINRFIQYKNHLLYEDRYEDWSVLGTGPTAPQKNARPRSGPTSPGTDRSRTEIWPRSGQICPIRMQHWLIIVYLSTQAQ